MSNLFRQFFNQSKNELKIRKADFGENWMVKKGFKTLYIGTKEKCQIFMKRSQPAG